MRLGARCFFGGKLHALRRTPHVLRRENHVLRRKNHENFSCDTNVLEN